MTGLRSSNPVSLSSQAIRAVSAGLNASTFRLVSVVRTFVMRFPGFTGKAPLTGALGLPNARPRA